jgi:Uma2 family endonuclease
MTLDEMKKRKKELGLTNEMIADKTGIPLSTVQKFFSGHTKAPRYSTIMAIEGLLEEQPEMKETAMPYEASRTDYTIDDYYALPDDVRVELIDGKYYDLASPTVIHQRLVMYLAISIKSYIDSKKGTCEVFAAPLDVRLDLDDRTMVQPDVMIICDPKKTQEGKRVEGAPDFVAEVFSPGTARKDFTLKYWKYKNAGVKEYWMIDPENKSVLKCDYSQEKLIMEIHDFSEKIPLAIYGGECLIDFSVFA